MMKVDFAVVVTICVLAVGCAPEMEVQKMKASASVQAVAENPVVVQRAVDWTKSYIVVEPETTRAIQCVSELERRRYFNICDKGTGFDQRMEAGEGVYEELRGLGVSFGRNLGLVKGWKNKLKEDPNRPGFADLSELKKYKPAEPGERFRMDFGPNLNVAAHGNHNAYPEFMGRHFKGSSDYHGTPEYIPENIEAAALLAAAVLKFGYSDFDRPAFYEPLNEPHWEFFNDPHLADWHLKTMETVHRATPEVKVGGLCMSVAYLYRNDYKSWEGLRQFIDMTDGKMDFYSFHAYDFIRWENETLGGRVQSGLPLEGVLDLVQNYTVNTFGKEVDVVVSEQGGYIHGEPRGMYDGEAVAAEIARNYFPGDTFEHEMKKRSIVNFVMLSAVIANTMTFMDHPHCVQKAVPFLIPTTWNWDKKYYAQLYVPYNYEDTSRWVPTDLLHFFRLFRGVEGRRVKALCSDPDLQTRAFVDGGKLYLLVNNQSARSESVELYGIGASTVVVRRLGRNEDFTTYFKTETIDTPETLVLAGRETVLLMADYGEPVAEQARVNEIVCYGDKVTVPMKDAEFRIKVPVKKQIDYAVLRVGLTRKSGMGHDVVITLNGEALDVPLEDCADRLDAGEYGTTKLVYLNPADLMAENTVTVSFADGDEGAVGTAVIRAAVVE